MGCFRVLGFLFVFEGGLLWGFVFFSGFEGVLVLGFWVVFRDMRVCCFRVWVFFFRDLRMRCFRALGVFGI